MWTLDWSLRPQSQKERRKAIEDAGQGWKRPCYRQGVLLGSRQGRRDREREREREGERRLLKA